MSVDDAGCPIWVQGPGSRSCLDRFRDGRMDASIESVSDVTVDADRDMPDDVSTDDHE